MSMHNKLFVLVLLFVLIVVTYSIYSGTIAPDGISLDSSEDVANKYPSRLTAIEIQAINPPLNGSFEDKETHLELAIKLAQETETLTIQNCFGDPIVFKTKLGNEFVIKNMDSKDHTIAFNRDNIYEVPALGETTIVAGFGFGSGIYGFSCDASSKATGMVLVEL